MQTAPELLTQILNVLGKINANIEAMKGAGAASKGAPTAEEKGTKTATKGLGINLNDFAKDKKTADNIRNTAAAIKDISLSLSPLITNLLKFSLIPKKAKSSLTDYIKELIDVSTINNANITVVAKEIAQAIGIIADALPKLAKGLWYFGLVPKGFKDSLINFMRKILGQSILGGINTKLAPGQAKEVAQAMEIIGDALPKLAKGVLRFGLMQKVGLVSATVVGITSLLGAIAAAGIASPLLYAGAAVLAAIGLALTGFSKVLNSITLLLIGFAGAIVIVVGAIWLASKLFKVGPLAAMGIIIGSILILAGGFALIGLLGGFIALGAIATKQLGIAMVLAGTGIVAMVGLLQVANMITGGQQGTNQALWSAAKSLAILGVVFAGLGIFGGLIARGAIATQHMGKGMILAAIGIVALGGVFALMTNVFKIDANLMFASMAKGLLLLGLAFAALGLLSILIIPGTLALFGIGMSLGIFALIIWGITSIIDKKLGGTKGLETVQTNIELMIGGVLKGVIRGISGALLDGASEKGFFGKIATVGKNIMILIGGVFLLTGVSRALRIFAKSIAAFQRPGVMKDSDGKDVNVIESSINIANSITAFFKILVDTFNDPKKLPDKTAVESMVDILMGNHGYKKLGIKRDRSKPPRAGLIDAIQKFAEVISLFAKNNQIPNYEVDDKGNVKQKGYVKPKDIAVNIVNALESFFKEFKNKESTLTSISEETSLKFAEILLGQEAFRLLGLKIGKDKRGLLEPILKFAQVLTAFAKADSKGFPDQFDEKGNPIHFVRPSEIAETTVGAISQFMTAFSNAFSPMSGNIGGQSKDILKNMGNFEDVIKKLADFSIYLTDIDKLAITLGTLANNIGTLSANIGAIDLDKLEKAMNSMKKAGSAMPAASSPAWTPLMQGSKTSESTIKLDQNDINKIVAAIQQGMRDVKITNNVAGTFKFEFMRENQGNLSFGPTG